MSEPADDLVNAAGAEAVDVFLTKIGSDLSTGKFVLIAESINEQGVRGLWISNGESQMAWDSIGLVEYARMLYEDDPEGGGDDA